ncbi:hypothetical protein AB0D10_05390 [Kitasatospora sp. NPDC048545]|uniref:hypothetical protein n=1 Tax=Kitasatospora sp. NPDC048545 TaxID=3157208 RepID=UPI0033F78E20
MTAWPFGDDADRNDGRPRRPNPCNECGADARWYVAGTVGRPAHSRAHGNYCGACGHLRLSCVRPPAAGSWKPIVETIEPAPAGP